MRAMGTIPLLLMTLSALPALAEVDLDRVDACVAERIGAQQPPAPCVDSAQSACTLAQAEAPSAAALCYVEARRVWSDGISATMELLRRSATEQIAAIAGIEVKYDILANLLQCDRLEELALLAGQHSEEVIRLNKTRCEATASGLVYTRLKWRARGLD